MVWLDWEVSHRSCPQFLYFFHVDCLAGCGLRRVSQCRRPLHWPGISVPHWSHSRSTPSARSRQKAPKTIWSHRAVRGRDAWAASIGTNRATPPSRTRPGTPPLRKSRTRRVGCECLPISWRWAVIGILVQCFSPNSENQIKWAVLTISLLNSTSNFRQKSPPSTKGIWKSFVGLFFAS